LALGLGEIELKSALNQPLNAEIRLVSATSDELSNLRVELAGRETFDRYGIDRPANLSDLRFTVTQNASGQDVVRVASTQSISEPFVTILVEASWARGRLLREYTMLLDPPVLMPAPATPTPVAAPTTAPARSDTSGRIARPAQAPAASAPRAPVSAPVTRAPRPAAASTTDGTYGPVQRRETLWAIAERFRPTGQISMNQMMVAIFQANPQAFNGNMNQLRRGAILRLPALNEINNISTASATQEVSAQTTAWRSGSGTAAAASTPAARLRLVSPEDSAGTSPTAGSGAADGARAGQLEGEVERLQGELADTQRLLDIKDSQLQELQQRLAEAEAGAAGQTPVADAEPAADTMAPGVDLEADELDSDALFADEGEAADELAADGQTASDVADAEPEPTVAPPAASTRVVTSAPPEPSLLDTIIGWLLKPVLWIALGVLAVLGTAAWYLRNRKESVEDITGRWEALEAEAEEDVDMQATARLRAQAPAEEESFVVVEQPTAAEHTQPGLEALPESAVESVGIDDTLSSQTAINLDQADPVAEADFHMAYGLYDQAADLLSKALSADPGRKDLKMKLLEVYFVWGNKDQFLEAAQSMRMDMGEGADPDWDKIVIMGRQICPDAELFAGAAAPTAETVDMDLDAGAGPELDLSLDDAAGGLDMDLGDEPETEMMPAVAEEDTFSGEGPDVDDLDIGAQTAAGLEAALFGDLAPPEPDGDEATKPDLEALSETQQSAVLDSEAPTAEMPFMDDGSDATSEMPTMETLAADAPTMEMPTMETPAVGGAATEELPTLEQPAAAFPQSSMVDNTAEINLDDLGLSIEGLGDEVPHELALDDTASAQQAVSAIEPDAEQADAPSGDGDLLSATGVTQVLEAERLEQMHTEVLTDDEATMMAPGLDEGTMAGTAILTGGPGDVEATMQMPAADQGDEALDLNLDDLSAALAGGDTVEQPVPGDAAFSDDVFSGDGPAGSVDLDVGRGFNGNADPTQTEEVVAMDPQTMTEVGTKLDLARAYIDMGDPEGARSILEEVLSEGDTGQRQEAEGLMESLGA
jgi:pilus assembly protein FimV